MTKSLIIVESPAKARTISKYLGHGYTVMASVGHVKDLPESKLGVDIAHNFTPHYVTIKGKAQVLAEIKKKAKEADKVYLAPDRDREAFRPEEYWTITATLAGKHPPPFEAKLHSVNGREADISTAPEAERIVAAVRGKTFIVQAIERKEKKRNPVAPFITSRLQQDAARKLRFSPKKTMTLAQQLYEGMDIGKEGPVGLITYMRTDSTRIAREAAEEARQVIRERFGNQYLPATPNVFKTQKAAQEAHEAIRPTGAHRDPESSRPCLDRAPYHHYN